MSAFEELSAAEEELRAHDRKLAKYFVAGAGFLVLGGLHMVAKNVPAAAEWLARATVSAAQSEDPLVALGGGRKDLDRHR